MSQLVPYQLLNSEQDDSLMFATMFDYQIEDYNKAKIPNAFVLETTDLLRSDKRVYQLRKPNRTCRSASAPVAMVTFARRKLQVRLT
ncbi:unnamed protein product, partial [Brenthis ino]